MRLFEHPSTRTLLPFLRNYLSASIPLHLAWETAQLPLYTLWTTGKPREITFAIIHCTVGDIMIAAFAIAAGLFLFGGKEWPRRHALRVATATVIFGISYTIFSEWLNVSVRESWAYSELMPIFPILGTGLSPVMQWLMIPPLALTLAHARNRVQI